MSRSVIENGNCVWRFRAGQTDTHAFVNLIHEIGDYKILDFNSEGEIVEYTADTYFFDMNKRIVDAYGDVLTIKNDDIDKLKKLSKSLESQIKNELDLFNKNFKDSDKYVSFEQMEKDIEFMNENYPGVWFYKMVNSMINYIDNNPKQVYHFLGEV